MLEGIKFIAPVLQIEKVLSVMLINWFTLTIKVKVDEQIPFVAVTIYVAVASTGGPEILVNVWLIEVTGVSWEVAPEIVKAGDITGVDQVYVVPTGTISGRVFDGIKLIVPDLHRDKFIFEIIGFGFTVITITKVLVQVNNPLPELAVTV